MRNKYFITELKEKTMASKKHFLRVLAIMLVLGMTVIGCDTGSTGGNGFTGDTALNGTWVDDRPAKLIFNDGNYEYYYNNLPWEKGTYSTNNGQITFAIAHLWGGNIAHRIDIYDFGELADLLGFEPELDKWYSMTELKSIMGVQIFNFFASEAGMDPVTYKLTPYTYSINGDVLILVDAEYNRQ